MQTIQLLETVSPSGKRYFLDGKRVSRDAAILAKFQSRQDCFVTRCDTTFVRNYSTIYKATL